MKELITNKYLLAIIFGAFASLSFAPFHFFIAAVISVSVLYVLLEDEHSAKDIFFIGFWYGFGYFLSGVYWIAISLLVDASKFAWLIPFALTLIPAVLALYIAFFALTYKSLVKRFALDQEYQRIILFAVLWMIFEILRANLFTGFPWNLMGYIWMFDVSLAQSAKIFGIYGLSFFAILTCLFPTLFFDAHGRKHFAEISILDWVFAVILIIAFSANVFLGRDYLNKTVIDEYKSTKIRLVQGNIAQEMKWGEDQKYKNLMKHVELTNSKPLDDISAVIWSETAVPYAVENSSKLLLRLNQATPPKGVLITGGIRIKGNPEAMQVWNSVFTIGDGIIQDKYDKHHLVPFGEYVPLQKYIPIISKITDGSIGFSKGTGPKTLSAGDNFLFSPLICYEVLFSDKTINKKLRPDLLVNVTNDAWFGESTGPYQHLDMARMRSIEYGIPMARVANTGVTAYIDPMGRIVKQIKLNQEGIFDVFLLKKLDPTMYEIYRYNVLAILIAIILLFLVLGSFVKSGKDESKEAP